MDAVCLMIALKLSGRRAVFIRTVISAFVGAVFSLIDTIFYVPRGVSVFLSVAVSFLMIYIAVGRGAGMKFYAKYTAILWGAAALLGGVMTLICSLGDGTDAIGDREKSSLFVISAGISGVFFLARSIVSSPRAKSADIEILLGERTVKVEAFIDTGNMARDPISAAPCIFIKFDPRRDIGYECLAEGGCDISSLPPGLRHKVRAVPVRRAGCDVLLWGVMCTVRCAESEQSAVAVFEKVDSYGGYGALAPPLGT